MNTLIFDIEQTVGQPVKVVELIGTAYWMGEYGSEIHSYCVQCSDGSLTEIVSTNQNDGRTFTVEPISEGRRDVFKKFGHFGSGNPNEK